MLRGSTRKFQPFRNIAIVSLKKDYKATPKAKYMFTVIKTSFGQKDLELVS